MNKIKQSSVTGNAFVDPMEVLDVRFPDNPMPCAEHQSGRLQKQVQVLVIFKLLNKLNRLSYIFTGDEVVESQTGASDVPFPDILMSNRSSEHRKGRLQKQVLLIFKL